MVSREEALKEAQAALQEQQFQRGLELATNLLSDTPADAEALYIAAVANRYLRNFERTPIQV